jgi:hypothetical protein
MSPSSMFDGDMSFNSDLSFVADEAMPTIELDEQLSDAPQPYKSSYTSRRSSLDPRRSSGVTRYSVVSAIPSESSVHSKPLSPAMDMDETRYTPRKERPRFRNPESVRAMQMVSPPLLPVETSRERLKGSYKLMTPSRSGRGETPGSKKSGSRRNSLREHHSPLPVPAPQQAPLVLLHVTILPPQVPYSHDMMERIMPEWLVENYKLLEEKLQDIILMRRGLLIPHPRDEYDLLEERILESLELKTPRLLKCGHFVPPEDDTDRDETDDEASVQDDNTGRGSRMSGGTFTEEHDAAHTGMCTDCHHELKRPGKGVGAGTRRWDIKIYAANGLMRANAWAACWGEMERCDVELQPWIPDDLRKTLEKRVIEEQEAEKRKHQYAVELQRQIQESSSKQKIAEEEAAERKRLEEVELQKSFEAAAAALERSIAEKAAEKKKFEEAIEEKIREAKEAMRLEVEAQAQAEAAVLAERLRALEVSLQEQAKSALEAELERAPALRAADIPLSTLLKNYVLVLLKDQKNFIILVLGALVVVLAMNMDVQPAFQVASISADSSPFEPPHTIAITTTATTTATAFSTLTVTQVQTATSVVENTFPTSACAVGPGVTAAVEDNVAPSSLDEDEDEDAGSFLLANEEDATVAPLDEYIVEEQTPAAPTELLQDIFEPSSPALEEASVFEQSSNDDFCVLDRIFEPLSLQCAA